MKTKNLGTLKAIATIVACLSMASATQAATVYDNSTTPVGSFHAMTTESGDQINLLSGTPREVSTFQFEYFSDLADITGRTATVRFYENNGASGAPGSLLFNSGAFALKDGYQTVTINGLAVNVPDSFTWTVEFGGLAGGDQAGLLIYDPPTVGSSLNDFWVNNGGTWSINQLNGGATPANFGARVVAVPEPGVIGLALLGGGLLLAVRNARRNRS